jgi:hypothetical protein
MRLRYVAMELDPSTLNSSLFPFSIGHGCRDMGREDREERSNGSTLLCPLQGMEQEASQVVIESDGPC